MTNACRVGADYAPIRTVRTLPLTSFAAGADVKVVQQMLGHKSETMTLDLYGHLFDDRLDEVAAAMDAARGAARTSAQDHADVLRTDGVLITLPRSPGGATAQ